jgi:hypothetical protein
LLLLSLLSFLKKKKIMPVCMGGYVPSFQLLNQFISFNEAWCVMLVEAPQCCTAYFSKINNNGMVGM